MGKKETDTALLAIIGVVVVLFAIYLIVIKCCVKKKAETGALQLVQSKN